MKLQKTAKQNDEVRIICSYEEFLKDYQPSDDPNDKATPDSVYILFYLQMHCTPDEVLELIMNDDEFKKCDEFMDWVDYVKEDCETSRLEESIDLNRVIELNCIPFGYSGPDNSNSEMTSGEQRRLQDLDALILKQKETIKEYFLNEMEETFESFGGRDAIKNKFRLPIEEFYKHSIEAYESQNDLGTYVF